MARIISVCFRRACDEHELRGTIHRLNARLSPDNLDIVTPIVNCSDGIVTAVLNPSPSMLIEGTSVCIGNILSQAKPWQQLSESVPDGSYAIFRNDAASVELLTDIVGSRTVWYVKTDEFFIASTSQRAIVYFLNGFQPNRNAFAWMLSAGTLGPGNSWDDRIRQLEPDARLRLDRRSWTLKSVRGDVRFEPLKMPRHEHLGRIASAIEQTFDSIKIDSSRWTLALSGGYDSRAILLMLEKRQPMSCLTWGLASSALDVKSDAHVASMLAEHFRLEEHAYMETDASAEGFEKIITRYLSAGEGRVDHLSGYMDGLRLWKRLHERGMSVIRGDEAFGKYRVDNEFEARDCIALRLLSDCRNLQGVDFELPEQQLPDYLERLDGESLDTWRDRMNQMYELPTVWAALNDVKCVYVELMNPLISRTIVDVVRGLPDALRTEKTLFKEFVRAISPPIPFAERSAIKPSNDILRERANVETLLDSLKSAEARRLLSRPLLQYICDHIQVADGGRKSLVARKSASTLKRLVPNIVRRGIKQVSQKPMADVNVLAFRAYLICRMCRMLAEDGNRSN